MQRIRADIDRGRLTVNRLDDGSGVLLDTEREQLLALNATGMYLIGEVAHGADSIESLASLLAREFQVSRERARVDAAEFFERIAAVV